MKIIKIIDVEAKTSKTISGENELTHLLQAQREGGISLSVVHFEDGARTHWHEHPGEQVLYILEGRGRVGNEDMEWQVGPGDVVYTAPGENHWHGAVAGESMTHLSITNVGSPIWYDKVE